ncbi:hypothetical protein TanjilG_29290 [Lupinus angustifolius]|uniref:Uncharacterized protein n=1 Tax=Lupinus angustifolius TaxID=3871 RepID=A0A1J7IHA1_LUPAN|nr:hypothetical protein TanjilG_29290 [Lupinus angustifolius]
MQVPVSMAKCTSGVDGYGKVETSKKENGGDPSINNADVHQSKSSFKEGHVLYTETAATCKANEKDKSFSKFEVSVRPQLKKDRVAVEALRYDFKTEKSEEKFKCDQIWW